MIKFIGLSKFIFLDLILFSYLNAFAHTSSCPSGCFCPRDNAATCCLFPSASPDNQNSPKTCEIHDGHRLIHAISSHLQWPLHNTCSPDWTDLRVEIVGNGWPSPTPKQPCTGHLSRLVISSDLNGNGYLKDLLERDFDTFFPKHERSKLEHFVIENTALESIENGFFERFGAVHLKTLAIRNNQNLVAKGFGTAWLAGIPLLTSLDLSSNQLDDVFFIRWGVRKLKQGINPSHLQNLNLSNNILKVIQDKLFCNFPYLEKLHLSNNRINTITPNAFEGLTRLTYLDLSGNVLTLNGLNAQPSSQPFYIILPDLETLDLSNNPLMRYIDSSSQFNSWWLSSGCPSSLSRLLLNNIEIAQSSFSKYSAFSLPPIPWKKCRGLLEVSLRQSPELECLPAAWLQVTSKDLQFPSVPKLLTTASRLCSSVNSQIDVMTDFPPHNAQLPRIVHSSEPSVANLFGLVPDTYSHDASGIRILSFLLIGGLLLLVILFLIMVVFLCFRKHKQHSRSKLKKIVSIDNIEKLPNSLFEAQKSGYFSDQRDEPRLPNNTLQRLPTQAASLVPIPRTDSGLLYNEHGVPVFRIVQQSFDGQSSLAGNSEIRPLLLSDGTEAYYPTSYGVSLISLSGPSNIFESSHLMPDGSRIDNAAISHNRNSLFSLQAPDLPITYDRGPRRRQNKPKPMQNSSVSCKSTSLSSFCASVHSANVKKPDPPSASSISTAPVEINGELVSSADHESRESNSKHNVIENSSLSSDCSTEPSPLSSGGVSAIIVERKHGLIPGKTYPAD